MFIVFYFESVEKVPSKKVTTKSYSHESVASKNFFTFHYYCVPYFLIVHFLRLFTYSNSAKNSALFVPISKIFENYFFWGHITNKISLKTYRLVLMFEL
jgi:hypothetical protein